MPEDSELRPFDPPAKSAQSLDRHAARRLAPHHHARRGDRRDRAGDGEGLAAACATTTSTGAWIAPGLERYRVKPDDPLSAEADCVYHHELSRGDWVARSETRTTLRNDATHFHFTATVDAYFNGERIFSDQDVFSIPRDFM